MEALFPKLACCKSKRINSARDNQVARRKMVCKTFREKEIYERLV